MAIAPSVPPPPPPDLVLEVTPNDLGAHVPGDLPEVTIAIVNRSTRTYVLPKPGTDAVDWKATIYFEYERASPGGGWRRMSGTLFMPQDRYLNEDPEATVTLAPGERLVIDGRGAPPFTFADDVVGKMRARLVYDVDGEWARRKQAGPHVGKLVSNYVALDQLGGPLEVRLEAIGPIVVGKPLDAPHVLRVTVRNRSDHDTTIVGPGENTGIGFPIERPGGQEPPKGDGPDLGKVVGPGVQRVLHPGEVVEVFGPKPELGAVPSTWTYPAAETFRLRANFYQPGPQHSHYSDWVTLHAVP
jgi:hypothetical protein